MMIRSARTSCLAALLGFLLTTPSIAAAEWIGRLRVIEVSPNESSDVILDTGSKLAVSSARSFELDLTAMLTERLGLEVIATMTEHDLSATGGMLSGLNAGTLKVIAPTFTLQYRLTSGRVQPYLGVGLHFTMFLDTDPSSELAQVGVSGFDLDDVLGPVANVGLDVSLSGRWLANLDVKYLWIPTTVKLSGPGGGTLARVDVDADSWVVGAGIGVRF